MMGDKRVPWGINVKEFVKRKKHFFAIDVGWSGRFVDCVNFVGEKKDC